jgi:hypothetical protein
VQQQAACLNICLDGQNLSVALIHCNIDLHTRRVTRRVQMLATHLMHLVLTAAVLHQPLGCDHEQALACCQTLLRAGACSCIGWTSARIRAVAYT